MANSQTVDPELDITALFAEATRIANQLSANGWVAAGTTGHFAYPTCGASVFAYGPHIDRHEDWHRKTADPLTQE